jgi:hypothetical protein
MSLTKRLVAVMTSVKGFYTLFTDSAIIHITPRILIIVAATIAFANCSPGVTMLTAICMIALMASQHRFGFAEAPDVVFTRTA